MVGNHPTQSSPVYGYRDTSHPFPTNSRGRGEWHALGYSCDGNQSSPRPVLGLRETVVDVVVGEDHVAALTCDGELYGWGRSCHGELGMMSEGGVSTPTKVVLPGAQKVTAVFPGINQVCSFFPR